MSVPGGHCAYKYKSCVQDEICRLMIPLFMKRDAFSSLGGMAWSILQGLWQD